MYRERKRKIIEQIITIYVTGQLPVDIEVRMQSWLIDDTHTQEKKSVLWDIWNMLYPDPVQNAEGILRSIKLKLGLITPERQLLRNKEQLQLGPYNNSSALQNGVIASGGALQLINK